jgi:hypothetical protein
MAVQVGDLAHKRHGIYVAKITPRSRGADQSLTR